MSEGILINPNLMVYFATITVTYPSGSTLTCSNGSYVLTAETTSGSYTFVVPYAGTWTVKAAKGSQSKSANVSVTTYNQSKSVTLTYERVIIGSGAYESATFIPEWYHDGEGHSSYPDGWKFVNGNLRFGPKPSCYAVVQGQYDLTNYKTLKITIANTVGAAYGGRKWIGVASSKIGIINPSADLGSASIAASGSNLTYSVDISKITGTKYVGIAFASDDNPCYMDITKLWLE